MNDNIQIINKTGEIIQAEGIAYIEVVSTNKKYISYTLNEKVDNDLTKIYVAETSGDANVSDIIEDLEWENLRQRLYEISHKEKVDDIKFLTMTGITFNIGTPKKLAVTAVAKQSLKDAQGSQTFSTNQTDTPATFGGGTFFNQNAVDAQNNQVASSSQVDQSIFANPPQPEISPASSPTLDAITNQPAAPLESNIASMPSPLPQVEAIATPVIPNVLPQTQPLEPSNEPAISSIPANVPSSNQGDSNVPFIPDVAINNPTPIPQTLEPNAVEQIQEISPETFLNSSPSNGIPNSSDKKIIITDEEALKAINIIQEYINQESENNQ